jgi:hypothetical protein
MKADQDYAFQGEIEIERIQTRVVKARSKYLIPVFDFVQGPRLEQANQRCVVNFVDYANLLCKGWCFFENNFNKTMLKGMDSSNC